MPGRSERCRQASDIQTVRTHSCIETMIRKDNSVFVRWFAHKSDDRIAVVTKDALAHEASRFCEIIGSSRDDVARQSLTLQRKSNEPITLF